MPADVEGVSRLVDTLDAAAGQLAELPALDEVGGLVAGVAKADAPRRTGALADTVDYQVEGGIVHITAGGGGVDYAGAVHKRNPFIARAMQQQEAEILQQLTEDAERVLSQVHGA